MSLFRKTIKFVIETVVKGYEMAAEKEVNEYANQNTEGGVTSVCPLKLSPGPSKVSCLTGETEGLPDQHATPPRCPVSLRSNLYSNPSVSSNPNITNNAIMASNTIVSSSPNINTNGSSITNITLVGSTASSSKCPVAI